MPKPPGRPNGHLIHAEGFEALAGARSMLKKDVAVDAGVSPQFLADLLAHRAGATLPVAERLAGTLGVRVEAIFPGIAGWIGPLPDRNGRRGNARSAA